MMTRTKEAGKCPYCGSQDINYGTMYPDGEMVYYDCICIKCNQDFREWYVMEYCETIGYGKNLFVQEIKECLEGMPCPMCTEGISDSILLNIHKEIQETLEFEFGKNFNMEDDKVSQFWWEQLELIARRYNIPYYEDMEE